MKKYSDEKPQDDGVIRITKRRQKHKPYMLIAEYPNRKLSNIWIEAYTKRTSFAKLQGALDSFKSETIGWKVDFNAMSNPTFTLIDTDTGEDLTYMILGQDEHIK